MFPGGHGAIVVALSIAAGYASGVAPERPQQANLSHISVAATATAPVIVADDDGFDTDLVEPSAIDLPVLAAAAWVGNSEHRCEPGTERVWSPGSDPPVR